MSDKNLQDAIQSSDKIEYDLFLSDLNENTVKKISAEQDEPLWMLKHRLKSLKIFQEMSMPTWWPDLSRLNFDDLVYFAKPKKWYDWYANNREDVPVEIKKKFQRLWIPEAEQRYLAWAGAQMDSTNFYHKIKEKRAKKWVIFEDMADAVSKHSDLVQKYFMKLVGPRDHKFAALHGAVWSGGTFIYVPKWIKVNEPLQAYFRMNTYGGGQFEHTLIVIDDDAEGDYIEWCSAPKYDKVSLHAWLVEVFVWKNSKMRYSSVENWSTNTFNLNTKRSLIEENAYMEWVNWNLGSQTTMLYPCSILKWDGAKTDMLGIAVAGTWQFQDTWSKVIHIGKNTSSKILAKSISKDGWVSSYRWLVHIHKSAENAVNATDCDALLLDNDSTSLTIPDIKVENDSATVAHEARAGKIDEAELFYLMSRGINKDKAMGMIVNWFFSTIVKKLPMEYAGELNKLIEMEMEGSVG